MRCTAHLITPGGESTSTKSSLHLCRGFPNRFYPWIQLPNSHKKSTIKLVSYTSYTWLVIYELFLQHSSIILNWLLIFDILISYNVMWSLIQREKWASLSDVFLRARAPHRQSGRTTNTDFITWPGKLSEVILTIIISGGYRKFFSRGSWFSSINHSAFSFHSKFFAELYLAIRSWTMLVVLDLTTTRTGELSDGKSGASFRTWQNCASLLFKCRPMNDRLPFYRLGEFIARSILKVQITNTTILQTYAESPRNKTHMANFQYDLLLGLPH